MADSGDPSSQNSPISFSGFPDDVQMCILSFLSSDDLYSFSCTSKLFASLHRADSKLWYALCDRRWGSKTEIKKWGNGQVGFKRLRTTLTEYEKLIGFWRRVGDSGDTPVRDSNSVDSSGLVFFEWGPSSITGYRVSPSENGGGYNVVKTPFIWLSFSSEGGALSYLDPNCRVVSDNPDLVPVNVNFVGSGHVYLDEPGGGSSSNSGSPDIRRAGNDWQMSGNFLNSGREEFNGAEIENVVGAEIGSPPDRLVSEIYQNLANRISPGAGGERAWRRQRRRRERGRRKWEPEHLVKIFNSSPSPSRPLQGLWKGICEDMTLDFYLVNYDDVGGIVCRRVGDSLKALAGRAPVFWTSDAAFIESPLSPEEQLVYSTRVHLKPDTDATTDDGFDILHSSDDEVVSRMMYINSSCDLVIPDLAETAANPRHVQGRIWQYTDGTFGFGFLRDNFIVDLKRIAQDGQILDVIEQEGSGL